MPTAAKLVGFAKKKKECQHKLKAIRLMLNVGNLGPQRVDVLQPKLA